MRDREKCVKGREGHKREVREIEKGMQGGEKEECMGREVCVHEREREKVCERGRERERNCVCAQERRRYKRRERGVCVKRTEREGALKRMCVRERREKIHSLHH